MILQIPAFVRLLLPLFQRFCGEHGVKLATVNKLFLTGTGAEEHAGLSGLVLTLSALGAPALEVFGPTGVDKLVVRYGAFVCRIAQNFYAFKPLSVLHR